MDAIDTTATVVGNVHNILDAGYHGIIRYVSPNTDNFPNKQITVNEISDIQSLAGMRIGLVFEGDPVAVDYFTPDQANNDAEVALAMVAAVSVPAEVPVFFTVDYDASDADIAGPILQYFSIVHAAFSDVGRLIGVYGSGSACRALKDGGFVHYTWLSQSTGFGGYQSWLPNAEIVQGPETTVAGLDVDTNVVSNDAVLW